MTQQIEESVSSYSSRGDDTTHTWNMQSPGSLRERDGGPLEAPGRDGGRVDGRAIHQSAPRNAAACPRTGAGSLCSDDHTAEDIEGFLHCPADDDRRSPIPQRRLAFSPHLSSAPRGVRRNLGSLAGPKPAAGNHPRSVKPSAAASRTGQWAKEDVTRSFDHRRALVTASKNCARAPPQDAATAVRGFVSASHFLPCSDPVGKQSVAGVLSPNDDLDWKADDLDRIDRMVAEAQGTKPAGREPAADLPATGRGATAPTGEFSQDDDAFATMDFDALDWKIQRARGHVDTQS